MNWKLITVGRPSLDYARLGCDEYLKRLKRHARIEWVVVDEGRFTPKPAGAAIDIVLDERGTELTTMELRALVDRWELGAVKLVRVLVGGSEGHTEAARGAADVVLALSRFTLQHELALLVFLEQLYRVYSIKSGSPYHR
jgi:23S rRNA (pseudouridine1915-N3)-methyltransferase